MSPTMSDSNEEFIDVTSVDDINGCKPYLITLQFEIHLLWDYFLFLDQETAACILKRLSDYDASDSGISRDLSSDQSMLFSDVVNGLTLWIFVENILHSENILLNLFSQFQVW